MESVSAVLEQLQIWYKPCDSNRQGVYILSAREVNSCGLKDGRGYVRGYQTVCPPPGGG
jgi:hypothetical protein